MDDHHPSRAAGASLAALIVAGVAIALAAQTPAPRAFEAASIRPKANPNAPPIVALLGDRFIAPNATLRELIRVAWVVEDLQISGGPGWTDSDRYSIEATAGAGVTADDARAMLRGMLADRFKLATHTEKRDLQGFTLVSLGRKAADLRPSGPDCAPMRPPPGVPSPPPPPPPPPGSTMIPLSAGRALSKCGSMIAGGYLSLRGISVEQLAMLLSQLLHQPVVERTKLTGPYDIDLVFTPDVPVPGPPVPADTPSLSTAVQDQLGLKLERQRVPTDVIVIDRVERPTEN